MNLKVQIIVAAIIIVALIVVINMIRKNRLELKYALSWLVVGIALLILIVFPVIMQVLASAMGIAVPTNMIFFFGFCFLIIILFTLTIALSRMAVRIKRLAQTVALLEKKLKEENKL